jgi:hypothetical protein
MASDLMIGTTSGYDLDTVGYWMNSLDRSGFSGRKVVLVCNGPRALLEELGRRGYECVTYDRDETTGDARYPREGFQDEDASVERFRLIWEYLTFQAPRADWRYVVAADMRDVVFQSDPSRWLEEHLGDKELAVSSEALSYADEPWNRESLLENFGPTMLGHMLQREIWNAGVIGGSFAAFRDLCLNVYLLCRASMALYGDQAAMNVSLSLEPFRRITRFSRSEDGWACHAGTLFDPEMEGRLREPRPRFDGEHVFTHAGKKYCAVHQYDRVSEWHDRLRDRYASARP